MILITGCAGCIGINFSLYLLNKNEKIIGVDNCITGACDELDNLKSNPNFTYIQASIEKESIKDILKDYKFEKIFHLACPTGVSNLKKIPLEMMDTLYEGTKNILDIAKDNNAKFLISSSSEVYGNPKVFPQTEEYHGDVDPVGIRSPYEEGKRMAETLTMAYVRKYKLDAKIIIIFNTYGPYFSKKDTRIIPTFITRALKNEDLEVHGKGDQKRTFLYIDDLINGFLIAMDKGEVGGIYNVGSSKQFSILDLAKLVIEITGSKSKIKFIERESHDIEERLPSTEKIQKLGWQETVSLKEGIQKIATYIKK